METRTVQATPPDEPGWSFAALRMAFGASLSRWMHTRFRVHSSDVEDAVQDALFEAWRDLAAFPADREKARYEMVREAAGAITGHNFGLPFLIAEWEQVVDAWGLATWEAYRDVQRLGRKTRFPEAQRQVLWSIFQKVRAELAKRALVTEAGLFGAVTAAIAKKNVLFDFAVVDEAQDLGVAHVRFLAALGGGRANALFFAGDLGQRIFQQPFSSFVFRLVSCVLRARARARSSLRSGSRASTRTRTRTRTQDGRTGERETGDGRRETTDHRSLSSVHEGHDQALLACYDAAAKTPKARVVNAGRLRPDERVKTFQSDLGGFGGQSRRRSSLG